MAYDRDWYPGQFVNFVEEPDKVKMQLVHRSSSKRYWFVWPELSNDSPDISRVSEEE